MFRRAMDYLGLGPDDAYDDYDASVAVERPLPRRRPEPRGRMVRQEEEYDDEEDGHIRSRENLATFTSRQRRRFWTLSTRPFTRPLG